MDLCSLCNWLRNLLKDELLKLFFQHCQPHTLTIVFKGITMDVVQGATALFTVVATNKEGQVVPDTTITVSTADPTIATATVNSDGTNGVLTGVAVGSTTLNSTDGTITATPVAVNVTQDLVVTTLTITPAAAAPTKP